MKYEPELLLPGLILMLASIGLAVSRYLRDQVSGR
jgi:hypothetical protein